MKATTLRLALFLLPTVALVFGCDSGGGESDATGRLSGVVRNSTTTEPVSGVSLRFGGLDATSGDDGFFEFHDVRVGSVRLDADAPGFDPTPVSST